MQAPEAYLRDVPRVTIHLDTVELSGLKTELLSFAESDTDTWFAEDRVLFPKQKAISLENQLSPGWNQFSNVELWVAFHALLESDDCDALRDRIHAATRPIERMDADAKKASNRGPNWSIQREAALSRDDWQCVKCGSSKENLHVHHRIPFRRHNTSESANRLENLLTVCPSCHGEVESEDRV